MIETKRIRPVGKVAVISISRQALEASGLRLGDSVVIETTDHGVIITGERKWRKKACETASSK